MAEAAVATPDGQLIATWYMRHGATFIKDYVWLTGGSKAIPASPGVPAVPAVPGTPVDLTGWTARCEFREEIDSETVVLRLTELTGITLGSAGQVRIEVSATQSDNLRDFTKMVADVELQSPTGFVRNLIGATVILGKASTRAVVP